MQNQQLSVKDFRQNETEHNPDIMKYLVILAVKDVVAKLPQMDTGKGERVQFSLIRGDLVV